MLTCCVLLASTLPVCAETPPREAIAPATTTPAAAPHLPDRFKALAGEWSAEGLDGNPAWVPNLRPMAR